MTPNLMAARAIVPKEVVKLVERLIDEQRILTRAIDRTGAAEASYTHRDAAEQAIYQYVQGIDAERKRIADDRLRLSNEVMIARYVVQLLRETVPSEVCEAEAAISAVVRVPDLTLASFAAAIDTLVAHGYAKRVRGDVAITLAGLLHLAAPLVGYDEPIGREPEEARAS